jgi:hypothetical protein
VGVAGVMSMRMDNGVCTSTSMSTGFASRNGYEHGVRFGVGLRA